MTAMRPKLQPLALNISLIDAYPNEVLLQIILLVSTRRTYLYAAKLHAPSASPCCQFVTPRVVLHIYVI
jgi:hypothetical protein